MKPVLTLAVMLSLLAAAAQAQSQPTSQPAGGRTAELENLWAQLRSSDPETREAAATELGAVAVDASVDLLVATLAADPAERVRQAAARSLGVLHARSARARLSRAARHDASPAVREAANVALHQIRSANSKAANEPRPARHPNRRPRAPGVGDARARRFERPPDYYTGLKTKKAGTVVGIGGTVVGAGLMVVGFIAPAFSGPIGMGYDGDSASEQYQRQSSDSSEASGGLLIAGGVTIGVSIIIALLLRGLGSHQMSQALDARNNVAISSSAGQLDLAWTF